MTTRTFLGDELYLSNQADIGGRRHGMLEENPAVPDGALIAEDNRASCTKAHSWTGQPSVRLQPERDLLVVEVIEAEPDPSGYN